MTNKYLKEIRDVDGQTIGIVDVYSVLAAFEVTEPGLQHAIKKLLMPGLRKKNTRLKDLEEAVQSINRTIVVERRLSGDMSEHLTDAELNNIIESTRVAKTGNETLEITQADIMRKGDVV